MSDSFFGGQILNNTIFASLSIIFNVNHLSTQIPWGIRSGTSGEERGCLPESKDCLFVWLLIPLVWVGITIWSGFVIGHILDLTPSIGAPWSYFQSSFMYLDNGRYLYNTPNSESWFWLIFSFKTNWRSLWTDVFLWAKASKTTGKVDGTSPIDYRGPLLFATEVWKWRSPSRIPMWNERMDGPPWNCTLEMAKQRDNMVARFHDLLDAIFCLRVANIYLLRL